MLKVLNIQEKDVALIDQNGTDFLSEISYLWSTKEEFTNDTGIQIPDNVWKAICEPWQNMYVIIYIDKTSRSFKDPNENDLLSQLYNQFDSVKQVAERKHFERHGKIFDESSNSYVWDNEYLENHVRGIRNSLLTRTDYLMASDYPITDDLRSKVQTYRQFLRDVTEQSTFPDKITIPDNISTIITELKDAGYDFSDTRDRLNSKPIVPNEK